jgi:Flp pilus assembly pilin Flp
MLTWIATRYAVRSQTGQTMAEYAVVLTLITAGIVTVLGVLSGKIAALFTQVAGFLP